MTDTGSHEQPRKIRCLFRTSHFLLDSLVVVDRSLRGNELVSPAVPENRLAAAVAESSQVGVIRAKYWPVLLHGLIPKTLVGGGCDGGPVQLRILCQEVLQPVQRNTECLRLYR